MTICRRLMPRVRCVRSRILSLKRAMALGEICRLGSRLPRRTQQRLRFLVRRLALFPRQTHDAPRFCSRARQAKLRCPPFNCSYRQLQAENFIDELVKKFPFGTWSPNRPRRQGKASPRLAARSCPLRAVRRKTPQPRRTRRSLGYLRLHNRVSCPAPLRGEESENLTWREFEIIGEKIAVRYNGCHGWPHNPDRGL